MFVMFYEKELLFIHYTKIKSIVCIFKLKFICSESLYQHLTEKKNIYFTHSETYEYNNYSIK